MLKFIFLSLTLLTILPFTLTFDPEIATTIDFVIEHLFMPTFNTGFGLAIVKNDQSGVPDVLTKGYGFRDLENQIKADGKTLFAIGSITKSFTATVVVKTLTEMYPELGEAVLDIPIRTLLPSINFTLSDRFRSEWTNFRDLLSHRTCINPSGLGLPLQAFQNKEELFYRQRYAEELCPFRTNFVYNNAAYVLAAEIIAQIANSPFEIMLTNLLRELGMNDTIIVRHSDDYDSIPNMSRAYYDDNGETKRYNSELIKWIAISSAPGGILSSSEDMLKYMLFHINNGKVDGQQIVSEEAMKYLRKESMPMPGNLLTKSAPDDIIIGYIAYGLGLAKGVVDGWEAVSHDGSLPPYSSYMSFYPALNLGIYNVANGPKFTPDILYLHQVIYDIIENGVRKNDIEAKLRLPQRPFQSPFIPHFKSGVKQSDNAKSIRDVEDIVGIYGHALEGEFVISQVNGSGDGSLYIRYGVWGTGTLNLLSESNYKIEWDSDIVQMFAFVGYKDQTIDFGQENLALLTFSFYSTDQVQTLVYEKDLTLDKLPVQPWASDSCGPVY